VKTLRELGNEALELIKNPGIKEPQTLSILGSLPIRLERMQTQFDEIEKERVRIAEILTAIRQSAEAPKLSSLDMNSVAAIANTVRSKRTRLRIQIHWKKIGMNLPTEEICERKASDSLARVVLRFEEVLGKSVLERLARFRVNRGPFVTTNLENYNYRTSSGVNEYQSQPVGTSGYYLLTHSSTREKANDLEKASAYLGFPSGTLVVEETDK
jgi:hypothetical protein